MNIDEIFFARLGPRWGQMIEIGQLKDSRVLALQIGGNGSFHKHRTLL